MPPAEWLRSIDATYDLVHVPEVRARYPALAAKVESALTYCEEALSDFGVDGCALSFNGGKDCTVLAHILAAAMRRVHGARSESVPEIRALYIACQAPFSELEAFIDYAAAPSTGYHMRLHTSRGDLRESLTRYAEGPCGRSVRAIFIGVRHDDPHGSTLQVRSPCDPDWPPIMRIHPLLDWHYADVWAFLRCAHLGAPGLTHPPCVAGGDVGVPYCVLYEQGYTSLGSMFNTVRNPELRITGTETYRPAYMLQDGSLERAGRLRASSS